MNKIIFITLFAATTIIWGNANAQNNPQSLMGDPPTHPIFPPHHRIMPTVQTPDQTIENKQGSSHQTGSYSSGNSNTSNSQQNQNRSGNNNQTSGRSNRDNKNNAHR